MHFADKELTMVLALTVALLFVVPAIFLWIGRMIEGLTSGRIVPSRRGSEGVNELTGEEWFLRPMRPMFGPRDASAAVNHEIMDERLAASAADSVAWYRRPLPSLFDSLGLTNWRRVFFLGLRS